MYQMYSAIMHLKAYNGIQRKRTEYVHEIFSSCLNIYEENDLYWLECDSVLSIALYEYKRLKQSARWQYLKNVNFIL